MPGVLKRGASGAAGLASAACSALAARPPHAGPTADRTPDHYQPSGSLARTSADCPVATTSIQSVPGSSEGTISSHSMTTPVFLHGLTPFVRVACQRSPLSRIHSTGGSLIPLVYDQSSSRVTPLANM